MPIKIVLPLIPESFSCLIRQVLPAGGVFE